MYVYNHSYNVYIPTCSLKHSYIHVPQDRLFPPGTKWGELWSGGASPPAPLCRASNGAAEAGNPLRFRGERKGKNHGNLGEKTISLGEKPWKFRGKTISYGEKSWKFRGKTKIRWISEATASLEQNFCGKKHGPRCRNPIAVTTGSISGTTSFR